MRRLIPALSQGLYLDGGPKHWMRVIGDSRWKVICPGCVRETTVRVVPDSSRGKHRPTACDRCGGHTP